MLWSNRYARAMKLRAFAMELLLSSCYGVIGILMLWSCASIHSMELPVSSCYRVIGFLILSNDPYSQVIE